jgi:hypothetical protein
MFAAMRDGPAARLLAEIERSGSGSAEFWAQFWSLFHRLTHEELRRIIVATGRRGLRTHLGIGAAALQGGSPPGTDGGRGRSWS